MNKINNLFRFISCAYKKTQGFLETLVRESGLNDHQVEAIANKLDVLGVFLVSQAYLASNLSDCAKVITLIFGVVTCAILWTISFILKGLQK